MQMVDVSVGAPKVGMEVRVIQGPYNHRNLYQSINVMQSEKRDHFAVKVN